MTIGPRTFVTGLGVVCTCAAGVEPMRLILRSTLRMFHPPTIFPTVPGATLPVAEVAPNYVADGVPRTHALALVAAREALGVQAAPGAIVVGTTTGGIGVTEEGIRTGDGHPARYAMHGLGTVGEYIGDALGVRGPIVTVSTACSSSAVAIGLGRELLRTGQARTVLVGGADALCRLTYHGFRELHLLSATGATPFDAQRAGLTLGEGAAFLLLQSEPVDPRNVLAELVGCGLSCDAFHATKPHPEGTGALIALREALLESGGSGDSVDYVNMHGTGTVDNDAVEAIVVRQHFRSRLPPLSSTKGLTGHLLGAAGALEAVITVLALREQWLPANVGIEASDSLLGIDPIREPRPAVLGTAVSNSFGFGGNNACLVFKAAADNVTGGGTPRALPSMRVLSAACLSASGDAFATFRAFLEGRSSRGLVADAAFVPHVPAALARRLKRFPLLALALAGKALEGSGSSLPPEIIAIGTAWGSLADTHSYLAKLFETGEMFSSPIDFVGSVHNSAAAQVAQSMGARGPNITCSSGDRSFEHAVLSASLLARTTAKTALVGAVDAWHSKLSPLLDADAAASGEPSDGGAAFAVAFDGRADGLRLRFLTEERGGDEDALDRVLGELGGPAVAARRYGAVLVGTPPRERVAAAVQLARCRKVLAPMVPILEYSPTLGPCASASAMACAMATQMVVEGKLPTSEGTSVLSKPSVLLLSLGKATTAMDVCSS